MQKARNIKFDQKKDNLESRNQNAFLDLQPLAKIRIL